MKYLSKIAATAVIGLAAYAGALQLSAADDHMMGNMPGMMHGGMSMHGNSMGGMDMTAPQGDDGPSSLAFQGANNKMHRGMAVVFTGDADVDFVRGMIAHHQGAIDMAKIVLAFGDDPEVRKLAEGIIKAQEGEIAMMKEWLKAHGG